MSIYERTASAMTGDLRAAVGRALVLLRTISDDERCPIDVRDTAEDASTRLSAALHAAQASHRDELPAEALERITAAVQAAADAAELTQPEGNTTTHTSITALIADTIGEQPPTDPAEHRAWVERNIDQVEPFHFEGGHYWLHHPHDDPQADCDLQRERR